MAWCRMPAWFPRPAGVVERRSRVLCRRAMRGSGIQAKYGNYNAWGFAGAMRILWRINNAKVLEWVG